MSLGNNDDKIGLDRWEVLNVATVAIDLNKMTVKKIPTDFCILFNGVKSKSEKTGGGMGFCPLSHRTTKTAV